MDTFDELIGEAKMEHEPTSDFTDRVMDKIEQSSKGVQGTVQRDFGNHKRLYALAAIAASVLVVAFGLTFALGSSDSPSSNRNNVAINTQPNPTTATTNPAPNAEANAVADEFDEVLTSIDKDLSNDISSNTLDTSNLNDQGI